MKKKILCVDDERAFCQLIKVNLEVSGYEVDVVSNGEEALRRIKERTYDLVITDLLMPKIDGWELCRRLKEDERTKHIPIIVVSIVEGEEKPRAEAFLLKPFDVSKLFDEVQSLVEGKGD